MSKLSFEEFKPAVRFLIRFVGFYLIGNILYGLYVTSYKPKPDPVTHIVTHQTSLALNVIGYETTTIDHASKANTLIMHKGTPIVAVFEGCNGINIFIVFIGFLLAFGPLGKSLAWFIPAGLVILHLFNIIRIAGLFLITLSKPGWLYFTHKYLFTAFIYLIVFVLWLWWIRLNSTRSQS